MKANEKVRKEWSREDSRYLCIYIQTYMYKGYTESEVHSNAIELNIKFEYKEKSERKYSI